MYDVFTYFAWFVLATFFLVGVAIIVALGSLPKKIAIKRNHPQVDAINAASWIGLALGGVGWPIAFVWAFLKSGPTGYRDDQQSDELSGNDVGQLKRRIAELELQLKTETNVKT